MSIHLPTVSSIKRVSECPGSEVLLLRVNESGDAAVRGNTIHEYICDVEDHGLDPKVALKKVDPEYHRECKRLDTSKVVGDLVSNRRAEVAYALDLESEMVRELGQYLGRAYPSSSPMECIGSLDWVGQIADGTWVVKDVKSGNSVGPPKDNWQLRFFAACLMYVHCVSQVRGDICYVRDGEVITDSHMFTAGELLHVVPDLIAVRNKLVNAHSRFALTGKVEVFPGQSADGDHCRYCPSFDICPAQYALPAALVRDLYDVAALPPDSMDIHAMAKAWTVVRDIKPALKRVAADINRVVFAQGLDLPDGRTVRAVEFTKTSVSNQKLFALARAYGASEEELSECVDETTIAYAKEFAAKKSA